MRHRTPVLAIVLAPIVLVLLVSFWDRVIVPLIQEIRHGDTLEQARTQQRRAANAATAEALTVAGDRLQPTEARVGALRVVRSYGVDTEFHDDILSLAADDDPAVAVTALDLFRYMAHSPTDDFDRNQLIPAMIRAMSHPDAEIRRAAYGSLSSISIHRPEYRRAEALRARHVAGYDDPDPRVRLIALVIVLKGRPSGAERAEIIERGMNDPDPYVRRNAVGWLDSPETEDSQRKESLAKAREDPDSDVRADAVTTRTNWDERERAWPIELWRQWQSGERAEVGMRMLVAVTVAAPIVVGLAFLLYYMARLLTYVGRRDWRAAIVVPVIGVWAAASYGMFLLYFMAAHFGNADAGEIAVLAAILWGAVAVYAAFGWGLHYPVRRN